MKAARRLLLIGALGVAPLLSGCVAAAIPLLAAGGVARSQRGDRAPAPPEAERARVSVDSSPPVDAAGSARSALGDDTLVPITGAILPPPAGSGDESGYRALFDFAKGQAQTPVAGSERHSAILAHPLDLRPETKECSIQPAAVLIDLDPHGATLDPAQAVHADPGLAATLAPLRAQSVVIGWISANSADRAGDVRRALVDSGLDPAGRDELVLLRYPEERKQTRREDFASEFCLVAIAGEDRSDFDELFDYIKNPFLAAPLDALLGNGWFLIPQPLT
jgi:hypothetical protein